MKISRRQLLISATAGVSISVNAPPVLAQEGEKPTGNPLSLNGWPLQDPQSLVSTVEDRGISGLGTSYQVVVGDVENILSDFIRQVHYRVKPILPDQIIGWQNYTGETLSPYSNLASGTGVQIYPGVQTDAYFPHEVEVMREILAEYSGQIVWEADGSTGDESFFYLSSAPDSSQFLELAYQIRQKRLADS